MYTLAISQCSKNCSMTRKVPIGSNIINICILIPNFLCLSLINIVIIYFPSNVFDDDRNKHCTVTSSVLTVTDENHKRCIFPILLVNVPRS